MITRTILAVVLVAAAGLMLQTPSKVAWGKRTEGQNCVPVCGDKKVAAGKRTEGPPPCPPFCNTPRFWMNEPANQVIAQRNQALIDIANHESIHRLVTE